MRTRSSKKDPQAQTPGSQSTLTVKLIPPESVQRPPIASQGALVSSKSLGPKRGREVEEEYPDRRRKDPRHVIKSTQHIKCLTEKNLEELDRQTGLGTSNGVERPATIAGRGGKEQPSLWSGSPPDTDQETASVTSHNSSTLLRYRWKNLGYARMFVEGAPLPESIRSRVETIIKPKISAARKDELSLITETFCNEFIGLMKRFNRDDAFIEPIRGALKSMDKDKKFILPLKEDWDPILKSIVQWKPCPFSILKLHSLMHPSKGKQAEPACVPPDGLDPTIPPPLSPLEREISVLKIPRPATTIGLSLTILAEKLEAPDFGNAEAMRFLEALEYTEVLRINPLKTYFFMCFPPMVVEVKSYSNGKTVYEGQNQAAVAGAYMTDLQHKLANFTESTSHGPRQSKEPLAFSVCTEGPVLQFWVHYITMKDDEREYKMNILKICHASSFPPLRERVQEFFEAVDGVMSWATSDFLDEIADQLVLVRKYRWQAT